MIENSDDDESDNDTNSDRPAAGDDDRDFSVAPGLHDDDNATASSQTEDDPVTLAMRATLDSDYDDEEEQILYPIQKRPRSDSEISFDFFFSDKTASVNLR